MRQLVTEESNGRVRLLLYEELAAEAEPPEASEDEEQSENETEPRKGKVYQLVYPLKKQGEESSPVQEQHDSDEDDEGTDPEPEPETAMLFAVQDDELVLPVQLSYKGWSEPIFEEDSMCC